MQQHQFLLNVDWGNLAAQKATLLAIAPVLTPEASMHLDGLVHMIDNIQDQAVDVLGLPESVVFPDQAQAQSVSFRSETSC